MMIPGAWEPRPGSVSEQCEPAQDRPALPVKNGPDLENVPREARLPGASRAPGWSTVSIVVATLAVVAAIVFLFLNR